MIYFLVPKCLSKGIIKQVLPLHSNPDLKKLEKDWVQTFLRPQPLGKISFNICYLNVTVDIER